MEYDIVAIGSTTYDSFYKVNFKTVDWETPSGRAYAIPIGEKIGIDEAYFTTGGNAANAAVTFARQGLMTAILTRIGSDAVGTEIQEKLDAEGIETKFIAKSDTPTARGVLLLEPSGERTILSYRGAVDEFSLADIDLANLQARWIYVSLPGHSYKMFDAIAEHARKNNILIALNPGGFHLTDGREDLIKHLKDVAVLLVNEGEAATLTGIPFENEKEVFKKLDEMMPGIAVVTDGAKGVKVSDGGRIYSAGIFEEKKIVDRTGAGDAFGSGFVAALVDRDESCMKGACDPEKIKYAIRLASANATSKVEYIGATEGLLTKDQFESDPRWQDFPIEVKKVN